MLSVFLATIIGLFSLEYELGVKYGLGTSSAFGNESGYELLYNISSIGATTDDFGFIKLRSEETKRGLSHNAGAYFSFRMIKKVDSVWLQSEVLWQRYGYSYDFRNRAPYSNNPVLASAFADTLRGSIDQTLDYITVPVLLKLKQELPSDAPESTYNGAYIYFGPSFSWLMENKSQSNRGIKALDNAIDGFVSDSVIDADPNHMYSSIRTETASDKVLPRKIDYVIGLGFNLKNIFNMGIGKDEFTIDCRFNAGMQPIGNGSTQKEFRLYSVLLSLGVKI